MTLLSIVGSVFNSYNDFGKAIGMNARKNGILEHINLTGSISNYSNL